MVIAYQIHRRKAFRASGSLTDPNVWVALLFDGADASTTFTDSSSYARTMTAFGNAKLDASQKKYGTASGYFDGDSDYIKAATIPQLANLNWRIEFWFRDNGTSDSFARIFQLIDGDFISALGVNVESGSLRAYASTTGSSFNLLYGFDMGTISSTQFDHFCISRNSDTIRSFKNGIQVSSISISPSASLHYNATHELTLGGQSSPDRCIKGWIDEFIIVLNESRTTDFTPASIA